MRGATFWRHFRRHRRPGGLIHALNTIVAPSEAVTPFLTHIEASQAALPTTKTSAAWVANLREFDQMVGQSLERLSGKHVHRWIEDLLGAGKNQRTVRYKLGGMIAYWKWLISHEHVDGERNQFLGRTVKSLQTKAERASAHRVGFPPCDVPALWQEADAYGDHELSYAIRSCVSMGWRLERRRGSRSRMCIGLGGPIHQRRHEVRGRAADFASPDRDRRASQAIGSQEGQRGLSALQRREEQMGRARQSAGAAVFQIEDPYGVWSAAYLPFAAAHIFEPASSRRLPAGYGARSGRA